MPDLQLIRTEKPPHSPDKVALLEPFIGPTKLLTLVKEWRFYENSGRDDVFLQLYGVSVSKKAYVVMNAELLKAEEDTGARKTPVRLHEMILENWVAAGGEVRGLRFVGFDSIVNGHSREAILRDFAHHVKAGKISPGARTVTVTPETSVAWRENPFLRCGSRLAESVSKDASATMKAHLAWKEPDREDSEMSIVIEFAQ